MKRVEKELAKVADKHPGVASAADDPRRRAFARPKR